MRLILYDGECGLCQASIKFVWKRDRAGLFHFAAIQSETGRAALSEHGVDEPKLDTFYYLDGCVLFDRSEGALRVLQKLPGYQSLAMLCRLIPQAWRDACYDRIAANRHKLTPKGVCELPPPDVRARFLES